MAERPSRALPIVEAKVTVPALPEHLLDRDRLDAELASLVEGCRVVRVTATAGSGKTTAVMRAAERLGRPCAWLTLDETERSPGSLLTYLEAALQRALREVPAVATRAMAAGVMHPEAAAMLAEGIPATPAVIVIDELERIEASPAALGVLSMLIRYAPPTLTTVLVGRREVGFDSLTRLGVGELGELGDDALAFTPEEAAAALAMRGQTAVDADSVVEAVGGWVTGVLFEAWRSRRHVGGAGGEADPLAGYLAEQIIDGLSDEEREFLIVTSLFTDVDADRARALGQDDGPALLDRLRPRHLPATWPRESALRCHPRFREYLRALLDRRDPSEVRELRRRHALRLAGEGQNEQAAEELLAIGSLKHAIAPAEAALESVIARLDFELARSWLDRFDAEGIRTPGLLAARLSVAIAVEEFREAVDAADLLDRIGVLAEDDPRLVECRAQAAWAYWHVARLDDARTVLHRAPFGRVPEVVRYLLSLVDERPPDSVPQPDSGPLDALLLRIAYVRGRLAEVRDAPVSDWTPAATERIAAHRALGDLERTREMLDTGTSALSNLRFSGTVRCELMMDLGHEEQAREALLRGRARIASSGSVVFDLVSRLLAAKLDLRLGGEPSSVLGALHGLEPSTPVRSYGYLAEQLDLWAGYALLAEGRDGEALDRLRASVSSMSRADRILELPTAATYLAEAEWRAGHPDASDAAAELALEAAGRQGSRHLLLQALADAPSVLARRVDSERSPDGPWHQLGRAHAARSRSRATSPAPRVRLHDLGTPGLEVDGEARRPRIARTYAVLAYLAHAGGSATRAELLDGLFDGRADESARAYLRQALHGLRRLLPEGIDVIGSGDSVRVSDPSAVESDSVALESRLGGLAAQVGPGRVAGLRAALVPSSTGRFLDGIECEWVNRRREELESRLADARIELAVAAFEQVDYETATEALEQVIERDPYRERAWRLLMRIGAAQGADDWVIAAYRRCEAALAEVGLAPSKATRALASGLRR